MKKLRVAALIREGLVPPDEVVTMDPLDPPVWKMEYDIISTLRHCGHEVRPVALYDDLGPVRDCILNWKPDIAFMMLEEFHGVSQYAHALISFLELMKQPYTGCNARGLMLSRDKALGKKILSYHRIATPHFAVYSMNRRVKPSRRMNYPILVKSATEDASLGISQNSIVASDQALIERVGFIHGSVGSDALAEEYIDGRELYVGVIGNQRLQVLPVWEMVFKNMPDGVAQIATARVKWNTRYQKKYGIDTALAEEIPGEKIKEIQRICKRVYRALNMNGYGRIDLRMRPDGRVFVIEANANPNLEDGEDFAKSAEASGRTYQSVLEQILRLGLSYRAAWQE